MALKLAELYVNIGVRLGQFYAGLNTARKALQNFGSTMMRQGRGMLIAGGLMAVPFYKATKAAMAFEDQMSVVATMLREHTMYLLPEFSDGIRKMATDFGVSTKELSDAMYRILSAQIPAADAMGFLDIATKSAVAGFTDTSTAVLGLTKTMFAYKIGMKDVGKVADFLFTVMKQGQASFGEFAQAMPMVTAQAAISNVSLYELGAAVATTSRILGNARRTTFALSAAFSMFAKNTPISRAEARKFGFELNTTTLKTIGLIGVLEKLEGASADSIAKIFPRRALRAIAALVQNVKGYKRDLDMMTKSEGAMQEALEKRTSTSAFRWRRFVEMIKSLSIEVGMVLIPALMVMVDLFIESYESIRKWIKANSGIIQGLALIVASIIALGVGAISIGALSLAFAALLHPITLVAIIIGSLLALFGKMPESWGRALGEMKIGGIKFKDHLTGIMIEIMKTFEDKKADFKLGVEMVINFFTVQIIKFTSKIKQDWVKLMSFIKTSAKTTWEELQGFYDWLAKKILPMLNDKGADSPVALAWLNQTTKKRQEKMMAEITAIQDNENKEIVRLENEKNKAIEVAANIHKGKKDKINKEGFLNWKKWVDAGKKHWEMVVTALIQGDKKMADEEEGPIEAIISKWKDMKRQIEQMLQNAMGGAGTAKSSLFLSAFSNAPEGAFSMAIQQDPALTELQKINDKLQELIDAEENDDVAKAG